MHPDEIVVHEVQSQGMLKFFHFLAESIGQSDEAPHVHPRRQLPLLNIAGRDMVRIRVPLNDAGRDPMTFGGLY